MGKPNVYPFRDGRLMGLKDGDGKVVLTPTYDRIDPYFGSFAKIIHEGKQGLIDRKGRLALGTLFTSVAVRPWGKTIKYIYLITSGTKKGFILDGTNRFSGFRFESVGHLIEGRAIVSRKRRFGYIDEEGRVIVSLQYFKVENFLNGKANVIDKEGLKSIDPQGDQLQPEDNPFIPLLKPQPECTSIPVYDDPEAVGFTPLRWRKFRDKESWDEYLQLTPDSVWFGRSDNHLYFFNTAGMLKIFDWILNFQMISRDLLLTFGSKFVPGKATNVDVFGVRNIFGDVIIPEVFPEINYYEGKFRVDAGGIKMYLHPNGVFVQDEIKTEN